MANKRKTLIGLALLIVVLLFATPLTRLWWNSTNEKRRPLFSYQSGYSNGFQSWQLPFFRLDLDGNAWVFDGEYDFGVVVERLEKTSDRYPGVQVTSRRDHVLVYTGDAIDIVAIDIEVKAGFIAVVSATNSVSYVAVTSELHQELVHFQQQDVESIPISLLARLEKDRY